MTRIYLVETKSGGKVRCSFEVGEIYTEWLDESYTDLKGGTVKTYLKKHDTVCVEAQGYTNQKYAIEITNVREEEININYLLSFDLKGCKAQCDGIREISYPLECDYYYDGCVFYKDNYITRVPQSFQYIVDPHTGDKAILISCKKKHIDMILSGDKKYEFGDVLLKLLKEKQ